MVLGCHLFILPSLRYWHSLSGAQWPPGIVGFSLAPICRIPSGPEALRATCLCVTLEHTGNALLLLFHNGAKQALRLSALFPCCFGYVSETCIDLGKGSPSLGTHTAPELVMLLLLLPSTGPESLYLG